jgi:DNA-binding winged helix-turn-helix (wHTH) protein/Tol biopolymer transport system component
MDARAPCLRFGDFELDPRSATLSRSGRRVRIQPQPLRVLTILVERAGDVVSREELRDAVWDQATFVEFDQGLNYCIRQIRSALGDDATKPIVIETLKKRGYQFIAPVERIVPDVPQKIDRAAPEAPGDVGARAVPAPRRGWLRPATYGAAAVVVLAAAIVAGVLVDRRPAAITYTQITSFSNDAFEPAVSPDGRMVAFIVGSDVTFPPVGEIYTKELPNGEPIQRTHDGSRKYGVTFSPDGSQITYTVADTTHGWSTETLPALGGEPRLLLLNAAGLTWLDEHHVLFSEVKSGLHMGLVQATANRSDVRGIYLPKHQRGMAHYAYASPDRSSVLVVEMGATGAIERCRLVPFDGRSEGRQVGPAGACTSAAWSPDGRWMYFAARVNGGSHLWRQRFPSGELEQMTSSPADEDGVAISADGRSIVASVGMREGGVWMHEAGRDRPISPDGYASALSFSRDGRTLFYLLRRVASESTRELWKTDIATDKSEPIITDRTILGYDVSADGSQVVFSAPSAEGIAELSLAPLDGRSGPRVLGPARGDEPFFGPDGDVLFRQSDGVNNYLFDVKLDGSTPVKAMRNPILHFRGMSPDRRWAVVQVPVDEVPRTAVIAVSLGDGAVKRVCPAECMVRWSPDGTRFYVEPFLQGRGGAKAIAIPVPERAAVPDMPASGLRSASDSVELRGSAVLDLSAYDLAHNGGSIAPGPGPDTFAYAKTTSHRNLFRIQLP